MAELDTTDSDYQISKPRSSDTPDDITLTLPRKSLLKATAELATRCKVSHRVATVMTAKVVKVYGGDLGQCSLSKSTSQRHRKLQLKSAESRIKQNFKEHMPDFIFLHWDGKIIKYEKRQETDDCLAIVASFP